MNRRDLLKVFLAAVAMTAVATTIVKQASADAAYDHNKRLNALIEEMRAHRTRGPNAEFDRLRQAYIEEFNKMPPKTPQLQMGRTMTFPGNVDWRTGKPKQIPVLEINPAIVQWKKP